MANQNNPTTQNNPFGSAAQGGGSAQNAPATGSKMESGSTGINMPDATDAIDKAKDTAKTLLDQAKTTAGDAYGTVTEKATSKIEEQKAGISTGLTSVADSVRKVGTTLNENPEKNPVTEYSAQYADKAARKLEQAAKYIEQRDLKTIARDVETYARRNPAIFLGSAFALGILAARFIKSAPTPSIPQMGTAPDHQLPSQTGASRVGNGGAGLGRSGSGTAM